MTEDKHDFEFELQKFQYRKRYEVTCDVPPMGAEVDTHQVSIPQAV